MTKTSNPSQQYAKCYASYVKARRAKSRAEEAMIKVLSSGIADQLVCRGFRTACHDTTVEAQNLASQYVYNDSWGPEDSSLDSAIAAAVENRDSGYDI
jgi:hypothetical protein